MSFPKQTDTKDSLEVGYTPGLAKSMRGFGCHFCVLTKAVTNFLTIDNTITPDDLIDMASEGIKDGVIKNNDKPIVWDKNKPGYYDWFRMFIPDSKNYLEWAAAYWKQSVTAEYKRIDALKLIRYPSYMPGYQYAEIEYKDEVCQHFVGQDNPQPGTLITPDYNPDQNLALEYVLSIRYIKLARA